MAWVEVRNIAQFSLNNGFFLSQHHKHKWPSYTSVNMTLLFGPPCNMWTLQIFVRMLPKILALPSVAMHGQLLAEY